MTLLEKDITNPDPNAPYIDWTKKSGGEVYYDARDSMYYAVLIDANEDYPTPTNQASYLPLGHDAIQQFLIEQEVNYATSQERADWIFNKTFKAFPLPLFVRIIENSLLSFRPKSIGPEIFSLFSLSEKL